MSTVQPNSLFRIDVHHIFRHFPCNRYAVVATFLQSTDSVVEKRLFFFVLSLPASNGNSIWPAKKILYQQKLFITVY